MELTDAINHLKESLADPTHKWGCEEWRYYDEAMKLLGGTENAEN